MSANRHPDMIDEWLVGQDMAYGYTITMTDNVYMTNEAWTQADSYIKYPAVVRTGNTNGNTGQTLLLCKGMAANRHPDMIDEWLVGQDMAYGSTITMTDNVYMTNEAWTQADSYIMKGYRKLPIVKENPDWDIIEFLDIFKAHKACYQANKVCTNDNCSPIKDKSQSSQANQV